MRKLLLLLLSIPVFAIAQEGIHFEHGLSWKDIQARAKAENKYIFVDAFTTWCGPCKYMSANIFPMKEVGSFFNANFISVKVQLDSTKNDNEEVKKMYAGAHNIMKSYQVNVFPTYLFFDPKGSIVHRAVGSSEADEFIAKGKNAIDPAKQYYTLLAKYKAGNSNPDFLRNLAYVCKRDAYDQVNEKLVSEAYLKTQKNLWTKDNIEFINEFTQSSKDVGFSLILNNAKKFDEAVGAGSANEKAVSILMSEEIFPKIFKPKQTTPDWNALSDALNKKYPLYAKEIMSRSKVTYYQRKNDWNNFQTAVVDYMKNYGSKVSPEQLNNFAWTVFENCKDMTCVTEALSWSKRSFEKNKEPMFMDTYANILYKLGRKNEAIEWESKAVALVSESDKKGYTETLDKMKKGEKTWKD